MPQSIYVDQSRTCFPREMPQPETTISLDSEELYFYDWVLNLETRPSIGRQEISAAFNYHVQVLQHDNGAHPDDLTLVEEARDALASAVEAAENDAEKAAENEVVEALVAAVKASSCKRKRAVNTVEDLPWRQAQP